MLPTSDGHYFLDNYRISYLSTGRDVLRLTDGGPRECSEPLVLADPDFDLKGRKSRTTKKTPASTHSQLRELSSQTMHFGRLPGTHIEGQCISKMLRVKPLLAKQALESQIKSCHSPRILHLATHGFFLQDQTLSEQETVNTSARNHSNLDGKSRLRAPGS